MMWRGFFCVAICGATTAFGQSPFIVVQSTTSTANSGLYDAILPQFEAISGIEAHVVAVGTGQALKNAANCDGDVLLVHARTAEEAFVAQGYGVARFDVMYNDFVLVGPQGDPARVAGGKDARAALAQVAAAQAVFVSRGDDSGTHKAELRFWAQVPDAASDSWYRELGAGMGATLNAAVAMEAYTLTDRATWLSFGNRAAHRVVVEGDPALFNQYGVIAVSPEHCPRVKAAEAQAFVEWILGAAGQAAIAGFRLNDTQLFFPNAGAR
jgi:tungstate transport system substrate-binding protein